LVKAVFVIFVPLTIVWIGSLEFIRLRQHREISRVQICRAVFYSARWLGVPLLIALGVMLAVNAHKFGSPFESGYDQWGQDGKPLLSGNLLAGLDAQLMDIQGSIFLHFPTLIFALFGYYHFSKNHPADVALFVTGGLLLLLINSKLLVPLGTWCYGPRYMLPILPLLSLPFVAVLEFLLVHLRKGWSIACLVLVLTSLAYSFTLQVNVNALPFFAFFKLQNFFSYAHNPEVDHYFASHPFGVINGDFLAWKKGQPLEVIEIVSPNLDPEARARLIAVIHKETPSNYYWWPDPTPPQSP
jgi:hypothetical protein